MDRLSESAAAPPRIAVIVPVLDDTDALERLLGDCAAQSRMPAELIIVAGADPVPVRAAVRRASAEFDACRVIAAPASRGRQLDAGARAAAADVLWFVHADARLPPNACAAVAAAVAGGASGGCLRLRFEAPRHPLAGVVEWLVRLRIACRGMAYGDQALFCTREQYLISGGFPHVPLFEEVPLVRHLQRTGGFAALPVPVGVSSRRWQRDGWLRRSLHNRWLALRYALGATPQSLARAYEARASGAQTPAAGVRPSAQR